MDVKPQRLEEIFDLFDLLQSSFEQTLAATMEDDVQKA